MPTDLNLYSSPTGGQSERIKKLVSSISSFLERKRISKYLEVLGSLLIIAATIFASMGMGIMFVTYMLSNICWIGFSAIHGFKYLFMLNLILFLINMVGAIRVVIEAWR